jgi:hypothetical protein
MTNYSTTTNKKVFHKATKYGYKKYGSDKRSYVPVANTSNDNRCRISTKINNDQQIVCPNGNKINAITNNNDKTLVKMCCDCGITFEKNYMGIFNHFDAITDFCDHHRDVI